jgi:DNA-directed RNA polymerase specialized sigma24 family protein
MLMGEMAGTTFSSFVDENETRLRHALTARFGSEVGREAAADALAYGWEHWDRLYSMDEPVGHLYAVGKDRVRRMKQSRRVVFPTVPAERAPWVEPGLSEAVADLPERQRIVVLLLNGYDWTHDQVAEVLGSSRSSVQRHGDRAIEVLGRKLAVESSASPREGLGGTVTDAAVRSTTQDIHHQLGELCTVIDEEQGRITEHDVRIRTDSVVVIGATTSSPLHTVRRRWWPIAVGAVTVIIAASLPLFVLSDTEEETAPSISAAANGWSRILNEHDVFGGSGYQRMEAITDGGLGLVAVGFDTSEEGQRAAVWTSVDGSIWTRVPDEGTDFGTADNEVMRDVTAGGPGLVAVGSICRETQVEYYEDGYQDEYCVDGPAAVWTSDDGVTWARVPHDESIFGGKGEVEMTSVTTGGPGLVVVGSERSIDEGWYDEGWYGVESETAVVWTSVDGITWSRLALGDAVLDGDAMQSVTRGGPGLVAVGSAPSAMGESIAAIWTSVDGLNWSRVPYTRNVFGDGKGWQGGVGASSVTAGGPGLVAVGGPDSAAIVWISVAGIIWSQLPPDSDFIGPGDQSIRSVLAGGPGLVAVGTENLRVPRPGVDNGMTWVGIAVVWTSRDGITWSRVPHNESVFGGSPEMVDVVAHGSNLIAVGSVCTETEVYIYDDGYREEGCVDVDAVVWKTNN